MPYGMAVRRDELLALRLFRRVGPAPLGDYASLFELGNVLRCSGALSLYPSDFVDNVYILRHMWRKMTTSPGLSHEARRSTTDSGGDQPLVA